MKKFRILRLFSATLAFCALLSGSALSLASHAVEADVTPEATTRADTFTINAFWPPNPNTMNLDEQFRLLADAGITELLGAGNGCDTPEIQTNTLPEISQNSESYIRSAAYIYEKKQYESTILDAETKLIRAKRQPSTFIIQQEIQDLQNHYNQLVLQYEAWKNNQIIQANESYKQLTTEKNTLLSQLSDLERIVKNAIVMAPIDGYISEVKPLNTGDYIFSGEEIIRIIPTTTSNLKAELYVPSADIARIKKGDIVRIRFPGLHPSRYGQLQTTVNLVPPDFTLQEDGKAMFIVEADIHTPYLISKEGTKIMLQAGITAEGRIVTEQSTVLHMILRKLDFL